MLKNGIALVVALSFLASRSFASIRNVPCSSEEQATQQILEHIAIRPPNDRLVAIAPITRVVAPGYNDEARNELLRERAAKYGPQMVEAVNDFIEKNKQAIEVSFPYGIPDYVVIGEPNVPGIRAGRSVNMGEVERAMAWDIEQVSRIGFDAERSVAIIYNGSSGSGSIQVFGCRDGRWYKKPQIDLGVRWMS